MVTKLKEIESKHRLNDKDVSHLIDLIISVGGKFTYKASESDTYFSRADVDFMETQECLRIRKAQKYSELTYKPGTTARMMCEKRFWKKEVNIKIDGQEEKVKELLSDLGFKELVTVEKHRDIYSLEDNAYIYIDQIKNLGYFLEVEVQSTNVKDGLRSLNRIEAMLNLKEENIILEPYRDLLMKKNGMINKEFKARGT